MAVVAILVALGEDSETLPSDRRPIVLIRKGAHVRIARSMLAAAGHKGCDLVGSLPADAELLVLPDAGRGGLSRIPRVPCLVRYDSAVLAALLPDACVLVGSTRLHAPTQEWLVDVGTEMVRLDSGPEVPRSTKELFINHPPVTLRVDLNALRMQAVGIPSGIGQKVVLRSETLAGVRLRDGDRVLSPPVKGYEYTFLGAEDEPALGNAPALQTWWHYGGLLLSHVRVSLRIGDVRIRETNTLVARSERTRLNPAIETGDRVCVTLLWDDGNRREYDALASVAPGGVWSLALRMRRPLLLDPLGTCFGKPGVHAPECVAAGRVFDRPCQHDTECPFFDPRRAQGRCMHGTCVMPIGVANASFRTADPSTPPMMVGCEPTDDMFPYCRGLAASRAIF
jgi:hypothetical protein